MESGTDIINIARMDGENVETSKSDISPLLPLEPVNGVTYGGNDCPRCTYEEAIAATGYGRFHVLLLILCGWAVSSDAIEIICVSLILPSASCDLGLSSSDKGTLNASIFIGMLVGSIFWGSLADRLGRRTILMWSLTINGLGGLVSSTAQVFWFLLFFRLISGFGVGGSIPVIYTYLLEFQPKDKRGATVSSLVFSWMCGNVIAAGLAWIVIPQSIEIVTSDFSYNSWRVFIALCTIPSLTSAAALRLLPESPKFLLQKGDEVAALGVMRRVHQLNRPRDNPTFQITSLRLTADIDESDGPSTGLRNDRTNNGFVKKLWMDLKQILQQTRTLFTEPLLRNMVTMLMLFVTYCFGYYGILMWLPEMFARMKRYGGSICDLNDSVRNLTAFNSSCESPDDWIYFSALMTSLSILPAALVIIFTVDRVGRKPVIVLGMIGTGACVFVMLLIHNRVENLLVSCLFGFVSFIPGQMLNVCGVELFPTSVRSTAFGVQLMFCRIGAISGNIIFGLFMDVYCVVPLLLSSGLFIFAGLVALRLPDTTRTDVH